eukprot:PhF_6_TR26078/c0_g1_i3/m.36812
MDAEGLPVDPVKNYPAKVRKYLLGKGVPPEAVASLADAAIAKYPKESIFASLDSEFSVAAAAAAQPAPPPPPPPPAPPAPTHDPSIEVVAPPSMGDPVPQVLVFPKVGPLPTPMMYDRPIDRSQSIQSVWIPTQQVASVTGADVRHLVSEPPGSYRFVAPHPKYKLPEEVSIRYLSREAQEEDGDYFYEEVRSSKHNHHSAPRHSFGGDARCHNCGQRSPSPEFYGGEEYSDEYSPPPGVSRSSRGQRSLYETNKTMRSTNQPTIVYGKQKEVIKYVALDISREDIENAREKKKPMRVLRDGLSGSARYQNHNYSNREEDQFEERFEHFADSRRHKSLSASRSQGTSTHTGRRPKHALDPYAEPMGAPHPSLMPPQPTPFSSQPRQRPFPLDFRSGSPHMFSRPDHTLSSPSPGDEDSPRTPRSPVVGHLRTYVGAQSGSLQRTGSVTTSLPRGFTYL